MPLKLCSCGRVARLGNKCERCLSSPAEQRPSHNESYDYRWRKMSESYRKEHPFCEICWDQNAALTRLKSLGVEWEPAPLRTSYPQKAVAVDHIVPIQDSPSMRLDPENHMSICYEHHIAKTAWEKKQRNEQS